MKRLLTVLCLCCVLALAAGCRHPENSKPVIDTTEMTTEMTAEATKEDAAEETTVETGSSPVEETTEETTAPLHSSLYIPDITVEEVILYFNEVCLDAEFVNSGDPSVLQKWEDPILYRIYGDPTPEDLVTLDSFVLWLNAVEGFPGIAETNDPTQSNMDIHFTSQTKMIDILGDNFWGMDAGVTFWYDGGNAIYQATICYRTDLNQELRNSVILEEIYNGLGPIQDTELRSDSIIYAGFSTPQALTQMDQLILRLLYHPQMRCGMTRSECESLIRSLYY